MKYKKGDKVFYQNNEAEFVSYLAEDTAVVIIEAFPDFENTDVYGSCMGCNVGNSDNKLSCTCDDTQYVKELLEENTEVTKLPMIVPVGMIYDKPMVVQRHEEEINRLTKKHNKIIDSKKRILHDAERDITASKAVIRKMSELQSYLHSKIQNSASQLELLHKKHSEIHRSIELAQATDEKYAHIKGSSITLTHKELLSLYKSDETLILLKGGGVDNWEWYDESIGDNDVEELAIKRMMDKS